MLIQEQHKGWPNTTIKNNTYKEEMTCQVSSEFLFKEVLINLFKPTSFLSLAVWAHPGSRFKYFFHFHRNAPESFLYCCDFASGAVELVKVSLMVFFLREPYMNMIYLLLKGFTFCFVFLECFIKYYLWPFLTEFLLFLESCHQLMFKIWP